MLPLPVTMTMMMTVMKEGGGGVWKPPHGNAGLLALVRSVSLA